MKRDDKIIPSLEVENLGIVTPGLKVEHPMFGEGIVEEIYESGTVDNVIRVNFSKYGSKALVPEYARLRLAKDKITPTPTSDEDSIFNKIFRWFKS